MKPLEVLKGLNALYVEDDETVRVQTADVLGRFVGRLLLATDGREALDVFHREVVHLVIADIRMPHMGGLELADAIRREDRRLPIFITSSYAETDDLLRAVRLNFVDYLTKPLSYGRLKEVLADCGQRIIDDGRAFVRIDARTHYLVHNQALEQNGEIIPLTEKEVSLLHLLLHHRGRWVHKERIADVVWPGGQGMSEPALKNLILKLRNKLGREAIPSRYKLGYMLRAEDEN